MSISSNDNGTNTPRNTIKEVKDTLEEYLKGHFQNLILRPPLFYNWDIGIRFELGNPDQYQLDKASYMEQVYHRAVRLYTALHGADDELYLVTNAHFAEKRSPWRRKINVYRRYIRNNAVLRQLQHTVIPYVFADEFEIHDVVTNRFILKCFGRDLQYRSLLQAICNHDVRIRPCIHHDVFFMNITRGTIFHVYDDRGCDVIAESKHVLTDLYEEYNEWILDYDRARIEQIFERGSSKLL